MNGRIAAGSGHSLSCGGRSLIALLAPAAGNSVLRFRLDWPAGVSQVASHFFAYGAAYFLGECGQRLTGGTATAFKGTIVGVERRQHKGVPHRIGFEVGEASLIEEQLCCEASPSAKVRVTASARLGKYRAIMTLI